MTRRREIGGSRHRDLQARKGRSDGFNAEKQDIFLSHFAGSCNLSAACEAAGVSRSTVYRARCRDAEFQERWVQAQQLGYHELEAELLRRSLEFLSDLEPSEDAQKTLAGMDVKLIFQLLQHHAKTMGKQPGDTYPQRADGDQATERLARLMKRMRVEQQGEAAAGSEEQPK